ncbi:MAG: T9SS type A sorting domain-containing protein [Bacteroidetes bacterium]|nr:T9SS type A sorting domain-containing protein [Bacteroidota bacterium]
MKKLQASEIISKFNLVTSACRNTHEKYIKTNEHKFIFTFCVLRKIKFFIAIFLLTTSYFFAQDWRWQNPTPTGNNINDVKFVDKNIGWFVGTNGTIFKTTNGGEKWFEQTYNPRNSYNAVYPVTSENIWLISNFEILNSKDGGITWTEIISDVELPDTISYKLNDIYFSSDMVGWVSGNTVREGNGDLMGGLLLKTIDGGINWNIIPNQVSYSIESIQFQNDLIGYLAGGQFYSALCDYPPACPSYANGIIMKTTNGGVNWHTVFSDTVMIWDIYFIDSLLGWATGTSAWDVGLNTFGADFIFKTTDGGKNWITTKLPGYFYMLKSIYFADRLKGWAVGLGGRIFATTDGGETWNVSYPSQRFTHLNSVYFTDNMNGYSAGEEGVFLQTKDSGKNWIHYDKKFISGIMWDVYFINPDTGWFTQGMDYKLYKTTDRGKNWIYQYYNGIWAVDFADEKNGWGAGYGGRIIHTEDGGNTWIDQSSGVTEFFRDIKFVNSKIGWAAGGGTILKTSNSGKNWIIQRDTSTNVIYRKIVCQDSLRVWVYGVSQSVSTIDGGKSWGKYGPFGGIFFLNPDTGWGRKKNILYRTFDGGVNLENMGPASVSYSGTYFVSPEIGWTHYTSRISKTTDGGLSLSWKVELAVDPENPITSMHFIDYNHGWAVGLGGSIIRYGYPEDITSIRDYNHRTVLISRNLFQNYPNPFNNTTAISFFIDIESVAGLKIYDVLGREVRELSSEVFKAGLHRIIWDGKNNKGETLPSGIYFCRLGIENSLGVKNNSHPETIKILLIK